MAQLIAEELLLSDKLLALLIDPQEQLNSLLDALDRILPPSNTIRTIQAHARLNQQREALVERGTATLITCASPEEAAHFLRQAPDLADWLELLLQLQPPAPTPDQLSHDREAYLRHLIACCSGLDLTGVVPSISQDWRVPLEALYMDLVDASIHETSHSVLVGHPGCGKTTFVRHQALTQARRALEQPDALLPVMFPAARYAQAVRGRLRSLDAYILEHLEAAAPSGPHLLEQTPLLLIIDALDELPTPETQHTVTEQLARLSTRHPDWKIIVTCRPAILHRVERSLDHFKLFSLRAPSTEQTRRFVTELLASHKRTVGDAARDDRHDPEPLLARLNAPPLFALARNPLTLAFLTLLHLVERQLPDRRTLIYHRLTQLLLERWNTARSLAGVRRTMPYGEALRIFAPLAWWYQQHHPSGPIEEAELIAQLVTQMTSRGESRADANAQASAFLERLRSDAFVLLPENGTAWRFFHPTIAEYLAGVEVARNSMLRQHLIDERRLFDTSLREVLLFAMGELDVVRADDHTLSTLFDALIQQSKRRGRYDSRYSSLLTGLLTEGINLSKTQRHTLLKRLARLWFGYSYSAWSKMRVHMDLLEAAVVGPELTDEERIMLQSELGDYLRADAGRVFLPSGQLTMDLISCMWPLVLGINVWKITITDKELLDIFKSQTSDKSNFAISLIFIVANANNSKFTSSANTQLKNHNTNIHEVIKLLDKDAQNFMTKLPRHIATKLPEHFSDKPTTT